MKRFGLLFAFMMAAVQPVFAEYYEREGNYLYKVTPYTELWSTADGVKVTAELAHKAMTSTLASMMKSRILPEAVMNRDDLERFRKSQEDMDDLVIYLNDFIKEQRARGGKLEKIDILPDGLILFGGHKFSINMGKGVGASAVAGLVIMPVKVAKIDIRTNQTVEEYASLRTSFVGWPSVDVGLGIGGGARWRVGLGAIWDLNKALVKPDQFWGVGPGLSWSPVTMGVGLNAKAGVLSNWEMPGWVDFAFAAVALEVGPTAELGTPRLNMTTIMKGEAVMGLFEKSQQDIYKNTQKVIAREIDKAMRERAGLTPGRSTDDDEDNADTPNPELPEKRRP
ncbi:MAG: hypothetical protein AB7N80_13000 [Bdellovibrionales bacterium]